MVAQVEMNDNPIYDAYEAALRCDKVANRNTTEASKASVAVFPSLEYDRISDVIWGLSPGLLTS